MIKVKNMTSDKGNTIANQFIIEDGNKKYFQSYNSIIVKKESVPYKCDTHQIIPAIGHCDSCGGKVERITLDVNYWDYSKTTSKYRNEFLGESTKETKAKIKSGEYKLADLNNTLHK